MHSNFSDLDGTLFWDFTSKTTSTFTVQHRQGPQRQGGSVVGTSVCAPRTLANFERNEEAKGSPWTGREENGRELFWTF